MVAIQSTLCPLFVGVVKRFYYKLMVRRHGGWLHKSYALIDFHQERHLLLLMEFSFSGLERIKLSTLTLILHQPFFDICHICIHQPFLFHVVYVLRNFLPNRFWLKVFLTNILLSNRETFTSFIGDTIGIIRYFIINLEQVYFFSALNIYFVISRTLAVWEAVSASANWYWDLATLDFVPLINDCFLFFVTSLSHLYFGRCHNGLHFFKLLHLFVVFFISLVYHPNIYWMLWHRDFYSFDLWGVFLIVPITHVRAYARDVFRNHFKQL